jgi:hypothetical protein
MRRSSIDPQLRIEAPGAVEGDQVIASTDMLAVYKDLRDRRSASRTLNHLGAALGFFPDVHVEKLDALLPQQCSGPGAIGAEHCRVHLDLGHQIHPELVLSVNYGPIRSARARVSTPTVAAPARLRTRAHSSTVAPVVITSSTKTTRFPAIF